MQSSSTQPISPFTPISAGVPLSPLPGTTPTPTPPVSTGEQQHVLPDSRIPQMVAGTSAPQVFAESGVHHGEMYSEPQVERRRYHDSSESSSDEVVVITHDPRLDAASPSATAETSHDQRKTPTVAARIEAALMANDCEALQELLAEHPTAVNELLPASNSLPLVLAVSLGQREIVNALLKVKGIRLDASDARHKNAVQVACEAGNLDLTRLLVKHGASLDIPWKDLTALIAAFQGKNPVLVDYVLRKTPRGLLDFRSPGGKTALVHAIECDNFDAVKKLLQRGANPDTVGSSGMTPLHLAAGQEQTALAELLLRSGATQRKATAGYPLDAAIRSGSGPMVALLLANPPAGEDWKACALDTAIRTGKTEYLRQLMDHGISPETSLPGAISPLVLAAEVGSTDIVIFLLAHGAKASHLSPLRQSALSRAIWAAKSDDLILLLLSSMPEKVVLDPQLARKLIRRAKRSGDQRILNEMAAKKFEDQSGRAYTIGRLLN